MLLTTLQRITILREARSIHGSDSKSGTPPERSRGAPLKLPTGKINQSDPSTSRSGYPCQREHCPTPVFTMLYSHSWFFFVVVFLIWNASRVCMSSLHGPCSSSVYRSSFSTCLAKGSTHCCFQQAMPLPAWGPLHMLLLPPRTVSLENSACLQNVSFRCLLKWLFLWVPSLTPDY